MDLRHLVQRFSNTVSALPSEQRALLGGLAAQLSSLSDEELQAARTASSGRRGLVVRTGIKAGPIETED